MDAPGPTLNLHAILPRSRANGPGWRTVLWLQGCGLGCPGCFNPETHDLAPGQVLPIPAVLPEIAARARRGSIEGITLSGGEPLQQAEGVLELLRAVREATELSALLFSGYTLGEIRARTDGAEILSLLDVLVDGRYERSLHLGRGLRGSSNQRIHLLTSRYRLEDIERTPAAEVTIDSEGAVTASGIRPIGGPVRGDPGRSARQQARGAS